MDRVEVEELHYITSVSNVPSILEHGIVSHEAAQRLVHESVADRQVQTRRARRRIPGGLRLHQYTNLYFHARNAMLYRVINDYDAAKRIDTEQITILRVDHSVLDFSGVVITDINAAADVEPRWHAVNEGLPRLDRIEIHAEWWTSRQHMQRMMAEVLVPHRVPTECIVGAYVVSATAAASVSEVAPTLAIEVEPYMFFRGSRR